MANHGTDGSSSTQQGEIDPRLQGATTASQSYPSARPSDDTTDYLRLPPPPAGIPRQPQPQNQQHHYGAQPPPPPPPWAQSGFNSFYAHPNQHQAPPPHHSGRAYQPYHGAPMQTPAQASVAEIHDTRRSRACEACRNLKVKCEPEPDGGMCKRCAKANRNCVITAPSRKRQKKSDNRVAELERKIDMLTQSLRLTKEGDLSGSDVDIDGEELAQNRQAHRSTIGGQPTFLSSSSGNRHKRSFSEYRQRSPSKTQSYASSTAPDERPSPTAAHSTQVLQINQTSDRQASEASIRPMTMKDDLSSVDVVGRGLLSSDTAREMFVYYNEDMAPHMPIVVFPFGSSSDLIRTSHPILFLAILAVASAQKYLYLQWELKRTIMQTLADRMFIGESQSLEILQAIQIIAIWYLPEPGQESKYYQLIHMAAGLAVDLGINKRPEAKMNKFSILQPKLPPIKTDSIECQRAWLGIYLLYSSATMGMRRPNWIRKDEYLQDCMASLQQSEHPLDTGGNLCKVVYMQTLADELSGQILPNDYVLISESQARSAYADFERQMSGWLAQNSGNMSSLLSITYNVIGLYMHELVMQYASSIDPEHPPTRSRGNPLLSPALVRLSVGLTTTLGILETFVNFNLREIRALPTFYFAQIAHASVSLIKTYYVAQADLKLGDHAPVTAEMVETHLDRVVDSLRSVSGKSLAAATSLQMITVLQTIFKEHKDSTLETIKARYSGVPSLKGTQMLDLGEPHPTPQQRTAAQADTGTADGALHILSTVATGNDQTNRRSLYREEAKEAEVTPMEEADRETMAMGQLIGEDDMGFMSNEGFIGIMQQMWARSR